MHRDGCQQRLHRPFYDTRTFFFFPRQTAYSRTSGRKKNLLKFITLYCHKCNPHGQPPNNRSPTSFSHTSNKTTYINHQNTKSSRTSRLKRQKTPLSLHSFKRRPTKETEKRSKLKPLYNVGLPFWTVCK